MVVLATKLYVEGDARERAVDSLGSLVGNRIGGLAVEYDVGVRHDDFPTVTVEGEDAEVARNALREEWGAIYPQGPGPGEVGTGTLEGWDDDGLVLDAGSEVRVPADRLGLGPGTPSQVRERFGLVQHLPMRFVVDDGDGDEGDGSGDGPMPRLADEERDRLYEWTRSEYGRMNVNSATRSEVRATLNRAGHADDVVQIDRLGLLEQSVVLAPDTDPPGIVASVGDYLPAEMLCVIP